MTTTQRTPSTLDRYVSVRAMTEDLAAPLSPEDQTVQSMPDASPAKWHRAHTSWFFETFLLEPFLPGYEAFDPSYRFLFNSYYEAIGDRHTRSERGLISRPGVETVAAYRRHVDDAMGRLIEALGDDPDALHGAPPSGPSAGSLVELGLHHEQQHQELLLMDIKHALWSNPTHPAYDASTLATREASEVVPSRRWLEHPGGLVEIGHHDPTGSRFAFDNEGPLHTVYLRPFGLAEQPVTCGEWLAFMADGGYRRQEFWLSDGWRTVRDEGWEAPLYWFRDSNRGPWRIFTLGGDRDVDPAEPVCHVSYYEADAFAHWAAKRLPTEFEWEAVAATARSTGHQLDRGHLHPRRSDGGAATVLGDVWQWTSSSYAPYPGYRPPTGAVGEYNGKFMVNQYVLRGGSAATPEGHIRPTYRNFFPAHSRWAFSGVRLADDR